MNIEALEKYIIRQYESTEIDFKTCKELTFKKIQSDYCINPESIILTILMILNPLCLSLYMITPSVYKAILNLKSGYPEIITSCVVAGGMIICGLVLTIILAVIFLFPIFFYCKYVIYLFHSILPNKEKRELEILTYFQVQKEIYDKENFEYNPNQEIITDWKNMTNSDFCQKYFNIQSKNFVRYFKERAELGNKIQENFILFATNLPKLELLPLDSLRKILINPPKEAVAKEILNLIFEDYTPLQIERIFTNHLGKEEFHNLKKLNKKAQIYTNFSSLLENESISIKCLSTELDSINGQNLYDFQVKVLKTERDYREASSLFSNCVKSYTDTNGYIITFFMKEEPAACVHVYNQEIKQISGYNNSKCNSENIIRQILKENNLID